MHFKTVDKIIFKDEYSYYSCRMVSDFMLPIYSKLNEISEAVNKLENVGRRSELRQKAFEIAVMIDEARKAAQDMEKEIIGLKYEYPAQRFEREKGVKRG